jgi:hypothetical protein
LLGDGIGLAFSYLGIPQGRVLAFAELNTASPAVQEADVVSAVDLTDFEVALAGLAIAGALRIDAR